MKSQYDKWVSHEDSSAVLVQPEVPIAPEYDFQEAIGTVFTPQFNFYIRSAHPEDVQHQGHSVTDLSKMLIN